MISLSEFYKDDIKNCARSHKWFLRLPRDVGKMGENIVPAMHRLIDAYHDSLCEEGT